MEILPFQAGRGFSRFQLTRLEGALMALLMGAQSPLNPPGGAAGTRIRSNATNSPGTADPCGNEPGQRAGKNLGRV